MKIKYSSRIIAYSFAFLFLISGTIWADRIAIDRPPINKIFPSPNRKLSIELTETDQESYFIIKNELNGEIDKLENDNAPVLSLEWSPNSKSIVAVVQQSETSLIDVLFIRDGKWNQFLINDPLNNDDYDRFHVVKWKFKSEILNIYYVVNCRGKEGKSENLYLCHFDFDPFTGKISNLIKESISSDKYASLRAY